MSLMICSVVIAAPTSAVTIDWVTIGNAGNGADATTGFGAVAYEYRISKFETTNAQYAEFLDAVAVSDPNGLYNSYMGNPDIPGSIFNNLNDWGGITRTGSAGSYSYSAIAGRENKPVNFVSFYDGLRFANWLHNGQPVGAQGNATTESGAYTITSNGIATNSIVRNPGATIVLTSEDEWYKAAYYAGGGYDGFPVAGASSFAPTTCAAPSAAYNTANCFPAVIDVTDVGSYTGSASSNGTFDQAGNLWEWNESISGTGRGWRGGSFEDDGITVFGPSAGARLFQNPDDVEMADTISGIPTGFGFNTGFRVASLVPEPSTALLMMLGLVGLAARRQ